MRVHPTSPRRSGNAAGSRKLFLAQKAMTLATWRWFADAGICRTRDEFQLMPPLLFELYLTHKAGKKLSKRECARVMKVDHATTGPNYIARLAERGFVTIEDRPADDLRKDFVLPTQRLLELVEAECHQTARLFAYLIAPRSRRRR
jgi:hypothetical protein